MLLLLFFFFLFAKTISEPVSTYIPKLSFGNEDIYLQMFGYIEKLV
jgi:hypothetical protein